MRGRVILGLHTEQVARITPARAGKSPVLLAPPPCRQDHPRACGEEPSLSVVVSSSQGSPPRVRGRAPQRARRFPPRRITPARAGKRQMSTFFARQERDHPRACGEEAVTMLYALADEGSPPRVRGRDGCGSPAAPVHGITPARAGKRHGGRLARPIVRDHPRACGEEKKSLIHPGDEIGSPPRVRGRVRDESPDQAVLGITPARAGKRPPASRSATWWRDHPRACGEETKRIPIISHSV